MKDAKDARHAQGNLDDSNKKVAKLTADLEQKQKRLTTARRNACSHKCYEAVEWSISVTLGK